MANSRYHFSLLLVTVVALVFGSITTVQGCLTVYQLNAVPTNISLYATSLPIVIRSPNYPHNYPSSTSYTLNIATGNRSLVLSFHFRDFNVEYHPQCIYDALYLQGIKYCGVWESRRVIPHPLLANGTFPLNFRTDQSIAKRGFEIIVIPELLKIDTENPGITYK